MTSVLFYQTAVNYAVDLPVPRSSLLFYYDLHVNMYTKCKDSSSELVSQSGEDEVTFPLRSQQQWCRMRRQVSWHGLYLPSFPSSQWWLAHPSLFRCFSCNVCLYLCVCSAAVCFQSHVHMLLRKNVHLFFVFLFVFLARTPLLSHKALPI